MISFRKRWYEQFQSTDVHSSLQPSQSGQMTVKGEVLMDNVNSLTMANNPILILTQFYHLMVDTEIVSCEELVSVLNDLPNIISLKLHCVTPFEPLDSSEDEDDEDEVEESLIEVSQTNQIIEVYLEKLNDLKELDFLLRLCRRVKHLHINSLPNIHFESFIRHILLRIADHSNEDFSLLCLRIPTANDQFIEKLRNIIDSNTRSLHYTIKCVMDKIYFQWK